MIDGLVYDDENEVAKLIGPGVGGSVSAAIGSKLIGGITGRIAGAAIGSAVGGSVGGTDVGPDIAAAGIGAGAGYGAHRLIKRRGGYRAVAEAASPAVKEAGGRMLAALRRALVKSAAKILIRIAARCSNRRLKKDPRLKTAALAV